MKKKLIWNSAVIVTVIIALGFLFPVLFKSLNFGLDLNGGFEILYEVNSLDNTKVTNDMVKATYKTLLKRIDYLGISEPNVIIEGENRIRVQLAGITDPDTARDTLGKVGSLTFRDTSDNLLMDSSVLTAGGASVTTDQKGKTAVALKVNNKDKFYEVTKYISEQEKNFIVIWLDFESGVDSFEGNKESLRCGTLGTSKCLSYATVSQGFADDVIISGSFTKEEAESLVDLINSGGLTVNLNEISYHVVNASFGANSLNKTFIAGLIGIGAIILFMVLMYHFSGFISSIAVIIYTFLTLSIFWLFGGVLTLPGIAALVIGIGMAVDASVLSFSRIKDELRKGTKLQMAYKEGLKSSFMTILDSNVTTLLMAIILFIFGETSVKGFATMLIISIIVTMLIMVALMRLLLKGYVNSGIFDNKVNLFIGYYERKKVRKGFNFIKNRKWFYILASVMIIAGIVSISFKGLELGIDFKGGSSITVNTMNIDLNKVKNDLTSLGYTMYDSEMVNNNTIIKIKQDLNSQEVTKVSEYFTKEYKLTTDIGSVSNIVSKELLKNAILSFIIAVIGMVIYISIRYKFSYAISGIIALLHDIFIIVTIFSLFRFEITSIFIAALLSVLGYSINNTIVVFDRIRENNKKVRNKQELIDNINLSLNQTISRSIYTTLTTIFPIIALIVFGSIEVLNFNIALLIGIIAGLFSSICLVAAIWYELNKNKIGKPNKKKWYEDMPKEKEELKIKGINS